MAIATIADGVRLMGNSMYPGGREGGGGGDAGGGEGSDRYSVAIRSGAPPTPASE